MPKKFRFFVGLIVLSCFVSMSQAQTFEEFKSRIREKYTTFEQETQLKFDDFVATIDQEFADHLTKHFGKYTPENQVSQPVVPKPVVIPQAPEEEVVGNSALGYLPPKNQFSIRQGTLLPGIKKSEALDFVTDSTDVDLLAWSMYFKSDKRMREIQVGDLTPENISKYWMDMSQTNYNHLLAQFTEVKDLLNANDWAYYQLVKNFTQALLPDRPNDQVMLQWVLMNRSRYKAKIGFDQNRAFLMLPSLFSIYDRPFVVFNQINYYVVEGNSPEINTYNFDFPEADIVMDLRITRPFNTDSQRQTKQFSFAWDGKRHFVKLRYDQVMMDFYKTMPQCDIAVYLNSICSEITKNAVKEQFDPLIKGKSEEEAAGMLLSFVQQAFEYKTDDEVFHHEQYFFADELLYYPYADCEDRSVMYTYLVKTLLKLDVLALGFPGHMATAVHFDPLPEGDFLSWQGKDYVVADPTFAGAPVGMLLTQAQGTKPQLILVDNPGAEANKTAAIWRLVNKGGGYQGDKLTDVIFDNNENAYVCGYFVENAQFDEQIISGNGNNRDGFVAKFNADTNLVWVQTFTGSGNDMAFNLAFSSDSNLLVYGNFESELTAGDHTMEAVGAPDVFVARLSPDGKLNWIQKAGIDKLDHSADFMFVARFNRQGEKVMARLFSQAEQYNHYGLTPEADGNTLITGSFYATTGMNTHDFTAYNTGANFDAGEALINVNDTLVQLDYEKTIAGLFAAMQLLKANTIEIKGRQIQQVFKNHNPQFIDYAGAFYSGFGKMQFIKNNSGIVTVKTDDGQPLVFDKIKIDNEARIKIIKYKSGNVEVQVFSGVDVGVSGNWHPMNTIKLFKDTGDLLFDFDEDHVTKKLNLKKEILKM